jgi:transcriptional regulator with XRE-family HTH domain
VAPATGGRTLGVSHPLLMSSHLERQPLAHGCTDHGTHETGLEHMRLSACTGVGQSMCIRRAAVHRHAPISSAPCDNLRRTRLRRRAPKRHSSRYSVRQHRHHFVPECAPTMPFRVGPDVTPLVGRARIALGLTQRQLGEMFRTSMRTAHRWEGGKAYPDVDQVQKLARAVFAADEKLAGELAQEAGTTLQDMGLIATPKPESAAAASPPPPRPFPPIALMIDSILLAAVEAAEGQPAALSTREAVREILRAGFSRTRGLGLRIEEVDDALTSPMAPRTTSAKK